MIALEVKVTGIEAMDRAWQRAPQFMRAEIIRALWRAGSFVAGKAAGQVKKGAFGNLARAIITEVDEGQLIARIGPARNAAPYGRVIEEGRVAGEVRPPYSIGGSINRALARWAILKGHDVEMEKPSTLFPLARAIAQTSSQPQPYLEPALLENVSRIEGFFAEAAGRALKRLEGPQ